MNITLESRPCPHCHTENSIHINACHACGTRLPWADTEQTRAGIQPMPRLKPARDHARASRFYVLGVALGFLGSLQLLGGLTGKLQDTSVISACWYLGAAITAWKYADNLAMAVEQ